MTVSPSHRLDLEETKRLMDVADTLLEQRHDESEVLEELESIDRDNLRTHLRQLYRDLGEEVDNDVIDGAIDRFLSEQHRFRPPVAGPGLRLARLYVRRDALARRFGRPALAVFGVLALVALVSFTARQLTTRAELRRVRSSVDRLYQQASTTRDEIALLSEDPMARNLAEQQLLRFDSRLEEAVSHLSVTEEFFGRYSDNGVANDQVHRDNLWTVRDAHDDAYRVLAKSKDSYGQAEQIVIGERELRAAMERINEYAAQIRQHSPPAVIETSVAALLLQARGGFESRQGPRLVQLETEMRQLVSDAGDFQLLTAKLPILSRSARAVADEPEARELVATLDSRARALVDAGAVAPLRQTMDELERTQQTLNLAYRIVIDGGVWRYDNDNHNNRNYYLTVHAVDDRGGAVSLMIRNEETGVERAVSQWAERVDKAVYDRIAADKTDNGLIDDAQFGSKRRGFLSIDRLYPDVGQITSW